MKEKFKKISLMVFYILVWLIFVFSFLFVLVGLSQLDEIKNGWKVLAVVTLPFLPAYLLRQQIRFLVQLAWKQKLILSILLIAIGLFYWLQLRPQMIYSRCAKESKEMLTTAADKANKEDSFFSLKAANEIYDFTYKRCVREKGINK